MIRAGALGDTILTFPAVQALRNRYPGARIHALGNRAAWELSSCVDEASSIDSSLFAGLFSGHLDPKLSAWLGSFDLAIAWTVIDPTPTFLAAGIPQVIHASPYPPPGIHASTWLLQSLGEDGAQDSISIGSCDLNLPALPAGNAPSIAAERPAIIHPGAGAAWKCWPAERFAALGEALERRGCRVYLLEGPADGEAASAVQHSALSPFPVVREPSLPRLAALLAASSLVVGNDSGITHLAAAVGAPTVALFGPTDPASWGPLGAHVLRRCDAVPARAGQIRVCEDPHCLTRLSLEELLAQLPVDNLSREALLPVERP